MVGVSAVPVMNTPPVGKSLVLATTMSKVSLTVPPWPSLAVTFTCRVPTSAFSGVPLNLRVVASKLSQLGNAEPSSNVAL